MLPNAVTIWERSGRRRRQSTNALDHKTERYGKYSLQSYKEYILVTGRTFGIRLAFVPYHHWLQYLIATTSTLSWTGGQGIF